MANREFKLTVKKKKCSENYKKTQINNLAVGGNKISTTKDRKQNQTEILEQKNTVTELKNSIESFSVN